MHHEEVQPQASPAENPTSQRIVAGARQHFLPTVSAPLPWMTSPQNLG